MKTLLSVVLLLLLFSVNASAESFGPHFAPFTIAPVDGWTQQAIDSGVSITKGKNRLTIQILKAGNLTAKQFAKALVDEAKLQKADFDCDSDGCMVVAEDNGVPVTLIINAVDDFVHILTLRGDDKATMHTMIESITFQ